MLIKLRAVAETPKEKAIRELEKVRRKKATLERINDSVNENELLTKHAKFSWQNDVAEFLPGKKVFVVSKLKVEDTAVYFEGDDLKWCASVKREGMFFSASVTIVDKINFDIYGVSNYNDLKMGLDIIKKAVEKCA